MSTHDGKLRCDMERDCGEVVTHIDVKGFVYCAKHGVVRKAWQRCRKLTSAEVKKLERDEPISYRRERAS